MFLNLLSAVDWEMVGEKISDFFINWYNNELAFYLGLGGIVLLFVAILCFIIAASYKKSKKKAEKKNKNKADSAPESVAFNVATKSAPAVKPIAAPVAEVKATTDFAPTTYTKPAYETKTLKEDSAVNVPDEETVPVVDAHVEETASIVEETAPQIEEEIEEIPAMPYEQFTSFTMNEDTEDNEKVVSDETPVAPAWETPTEEVEDTPYEKPSTVFKDDDSWKSAKINLKKSTKTEKVASVEKTPAEETSIEKIKPVKKSAPKKKAEEAPIEKKPVVKNATLAKADKVEITVPVKAEKAEKVIPAKAEKSEDKPKVVGKYVIVDNSYSYQFCLYANNGQLLYESREYASMASCKNGVETFKKNIPSCDYRVDVDKNGGYKYIFKKGNSLYIGETYSTQKAAERSAQSVKRFVSISEIVE